MAPKKTAEQRARQSPARDLEENEFDIGDEDFNPPLNQRGCEINPTFDPIVGPPTSKDKGPATPSALETVETSTTAQDNCILTSTTRRAASAAF